MTGRNTTIERMLETEFKFTGVSDCVDFQSPRIEFKPIPNELHEIYARQFDGFYRYTYKPNKK